MVILWNVGDFDNRAVTSTDKRAMHDINMNAILAFQNTSIDINLATVVHHHRHRRCYCLSFDSDGAEHFWR